MYKIIRILFILFSIDIIVGQTPEELKKFMDTYDQIKVDQQANEIVKKGIDSEKDPEDGPVRLLIDPGDISKYYLEKMNVIKKDLNQLNRLLIDSDSIPPITHFGYNYFSLRDSIQFIDNANMSTNYILGYGDEIIISVWGQAEQHERKVLDRDGTVFIENVGLLYLGGKTQIQAKSYVFDRFSKVYATLKSKPQLTYLEFSIGKVKNINVSVSGHVQYPGNYVVNPSISIPNLLILAGGINSTGTLRNIFIQRNSEYVDTLDLYPLITGIGNIHQTTILDSDIIIVPPRGETVAVTGNVIRPAYFEIQNGDNIPTLLKYVGMVNEKSNKEIIITRSNDLNLYVPKSNYDKIIVTHGDSLIVPKDYRPLKIISLSVSNRPIIEIPWVKDLTFNQILSIANVDFDNIKSVELIRHDNESSNQLVYPFNFSNSNEFKFFASDHLSIHLFEVFNPSKKVIVKGEINSPGSYPLINNQESINSIIKRAGGLIGDSTLNNVIVKRDTLIFGSNSGELILTQGDTIIVKPYIGTVKVEGEVHNPGNFEWKNNNTAKNYLDYAGGLTTYGDKKHIVYITPYGEAERITNRSNISILPGSIIRVSEKPLSEQNNSARFQQIGSIVSSLVSIAILANTAKN